jgi:hypothetical protein
MTSTLNLPENYWNEIQVTPTDVENLHTTLFERETPLTTHDLAFAFIEARVRAEQAIKESEKKNSAKKFLPKEKYTSGDDLVFPALGWRAGKVKTVRSGLNPAVPTFDVLVVEMDDQSERLFAAGLEAHHLNEVQIATSESSEFNSKAILGEHASSTTETKRRSPLVRNAALPSRRAKIVSSRPSEVPGPGRNRVPR